MRFECCGAADCPGRVKKDSYFDKLTLSAYFAKQCQLQLRRSKDELEFLTFLSRRPQTLGQLWMQSKSKEKLQQRVADKATREAATADAAARLKAGLSATPQTPSVASAGRKGGGTVQVTGQTKLQFTPKGTSKSPAASAASDGTQKGTGPSAKDKASAPSKRVASPVEDIGKKKKKKHKKHDKKDKQ